MLQPCVCLPGGVCDTDISNRGNVLVLAYTVNSCTCVCRDAFRGQKEGIGSPEVGVKDGCELPRLSAEK